MSWIDDEAHRMTQGAIAEPAVDPVQQITDYLRNESLKHHASALDAECEVEREGCLAVHHALEIARTWIEANL